MIVGNIERRFQAARMRIGSRYRNLKNVARVIAGGLALSLERAQNIEDALSIRVHSSSQCPQCISVDNCSVDFKGKSDVLKDISFKLNTGDWLLVAGPSGSGKTSLLKLISGIVKPCKGCVSAGHGHVGFLFKILTISFLPLLAKIFIGVLKKEVWNMKKHLQLLIIG